MARERQNRTHAELKEVRARVLKLVAKDPELTNIQISARVGVNPWTIGNWRRTGKVLNPETLS